VLHYTRRKGTNRYLLISSDNEEFVFFAKDIEDAGRLALQDAIELSITIKDVKPYA